MAARTFETREQIEAAGYVPGWHGEPVAAGQTAVVYARGGWREGTVTKVTVKSVYTDVTTPTSPDLHTVGRGIRTGQRTDLYVPAASMRTVPGRRPPTRYTIERDGRGGFSIVSSYHGEAIATGLRLLTAEQEIALMVRQDIEAQGRGFADQHDEASAGHPGKGFTITSPDGSTRIGSASEYGR